MKIDEPDPPLNHRLNRPKCFDDGHEREMMLERQREGIAKAKAEGKYKGRKPTAREKADKVLALKAEGHGPVAIADELGISRSSVQRILRAA